MKQPSDYQEVDERFYERFTYGGITGRACLQDENPSIILSFLHSELDRVREEVVKEIELRISRLHKHIDKHGLYYQGVHTGLSLAESQTALTQLAKVNK